MEIEAGVILQIVTGLILAGAVYGGIRQDLKAMHADLRRIEKMAKRAHRRLDGIGTFGTRANDVR